MITAPFPIRQVAIVGGTHGNEFTGAYLVRKFQQFPALVRRSGFASSIILANPKAFAAGKRYIDQDLNRCFLRHILEDDTLSGYEVERAREIYQQLGPKEQPQVDFVIDLHTTTANMGLTIIPTSDHPFNLALAAHLSATNPLVRVYRWPDLGQESPFLRSICKLGCTIEVGPVPQGVLQAQALQQTEAVIGEILDYLNACSQGQIPSVPSHLTVYQGLEVIDYPRNPQGELEAMIHPQRQAQDYAPLHPGEPLFLTFDGAAIAYTGPSTCYPVFINEAAYYEKGIAMCLTVPQQISTQPAASSY